MGNSEPAKFLPFHFVKDNYAKMNRKIKFSSQPVYFNLKLSLNSFLHSLPGGSAQDSERCTAQRTGRVPSLMEQTPAGTREEMRL